MIAAADRRSPRRRGRRGGEADLRNDGLGTIGTRRAPLAGGEALVGQVYLVTVVALIVSQLGRSRGA